MTKEQKYILEIALRVLGREFRTYKARAYVIHGISLASAWTNSGSDALDEVVDAARALRFSEIMGQI